MTDPWSNADSPANQPDDLSGSIAIIGMAGRFPNSPTLTDFWKNLREGVELISFLSDDELQAVGVDPTILANPNFVKAGGIITDADKFDAPFFQINAREAEALDPQHRLFLETAWHALEDSGLDPSRYSGLIGVYGGCSESLYLQENLRQNLAALELVGDYQAHLGSSRDYLTTRVSYKLNLTGPSFNVQTGCSTALVAVHLACQSLLSYQSDVALAGGVSLGVPQKFGHLYQAGMIYSPDGHCRPFDVQARGIVGGQGVGLVVLKRLNEALAEGDYIHAVIKGSAVNNDGAYKAGYTAPSIDGQAEVIAMAQAAAEVDATSISYIEAHGTATPLGDPIEIAALTKAFRASTTQTNFCAVGSVKSNLGHADAAAGIAGLLKTVLALKHHEIPPTLHFENPNPELNLDGSPFYVNTSLKAWPLEATPRRAGVSSFGIGGTNAHLILEEAPIRATQSAIPKPWQILPLSAKTEIALEKMVQNLSHYLAEHPTVNLADVAYSLQMGRQRFEHRRAIICLTSDVGKGLGQADPEQILNAVNTENNPNIVFMFTGQGSQYLNMAADLYQSEPIFRQVVDHCASLLTPQLDLDIRTLLYPAAGQKIEAEAKLGQTAYTQPALFIIEYALAQLWLAWGIQPQALIGHSIGEYVAACLAGVFTLKDALGVVAARGRLMQGLPSGAMLSVALSETDLIARIPETLSIAALNSPTMSVISGQEADIVAIQQTFESDGLICRRLHTSHAFHSAMMDPILQPFADHLSQINLQPPQIPLISNITGKPLTDDDATSPTYWSNHIRYTVRFARGLETLAQPGKSLFLEIGPGNTLSTLARQQFGANGPQAVVSTLPGPRDSEAASHTLLKAVGRVWLAGGNINWVAMQPEIKANRIPLPLYPFERTRYWIDPAPSQIEPAKRTVAENAKNPVEAWLHVPTWHRLPPLKHSEQPTKQILLFQDQGAVGPALADALSSQGHSITRVVIRPQFERIEPNLIGLNPQSRHHYEQLIAELGVLPDEIIHLWNVTTNDLSQNQADTFERYQTVGYQSLLYLTQSLTNKIGQQEISLTIITNQAQSVTGMENLIPAKATSLGICRVIPQEYPQLRCYTIDLDLADAVSISQSHLISQLVAELSNPDRQPTIALRGRYRWLQQFEAMTPSPSEKIALLRPHGVYLITGGLGNIGLVIADYLAQTVQAKLILAGRSPFPDKPEWMTWLANHSADNPTSQKIKRLQQLEVAGATVMVVVADVADEAAMQQVVDAAERVLGPISGVIHAAGLVEGETIGPISQITPKHLQQQAQAKVHGTFALAHILAEKSLDFCLLTSSLASILGGLHFGTYAAANAFLDAFTQQMNRQTDTLWVSINWDAWNFRGKTESETDMGAALAKQAIIPSEGEAILHRLFSVAQPQMLVSTSNFQARFEQWVDLKTRANSTKIAATAVVTTHHARPGLNTAYMAATDEVQTILIDIWEPLLGIEPIGIHDNFFDLGGHSLLAIQVISRIQETFEITFPLDFFFDAPTVAKLAVAVEEILITALDELSEEEAQQLIAHN